jgi:hypothetical protein
MANEILYAGLADQRLTETLSGDYLMLITDRNALPKHPALYYGGDLYGTGSTTKKFPHIGLWAYDLPVATADGAAVGNTAWSDSSSTVAVAGYSKSYERSDVAKFTDSTGLLNASNFAGDASQSSAMRLTNLVANVTDDFTQTVGSSGSDLSLANFLSAINLLEVNTQAAIGEGEAMFIGHTVQLGDLRTAMSTVGGAIQWYMPSQQLLPIRGGGYRGRYMGVDLFASPQVPTANAGADRAGGMFIRGAVIYCDMSVDTENDANTLVIGGKVLFEKDRTSKSRLTAYVSSSYFGVSKGIDLLGVSVITDA